MFSEATTRAAAPSLLVTEMLEQYGVLVREALARYLGSGEPRRHLYEPVADYPSRSGRMLRPSLLLAAARAFGAEVELAMNTAVALELIHNAFLVHDDVEDEGLERRGRPTLNVLHGSPVAVNVGDALAFMSLRPLLDNRYGLGPRLTLRVLDEAGVMIRESIEGQAIELGWRKDNSLALNDEDYLNMVLKKTCWYTTIFPLRAGALIGTRDATDLDRLTRFGFFLGAAFQIQDDVLNLVGDHRRYGKELDGDIWEGKRTLIMTDLFQRASAEELRRLAHVFAVDRSERKADDVRWIRERVDAYGCIERARCTAHALAGAASHEFGVALGGLQASREKAFLEELPHWVLHRT
jgi:geranylgeranyl diphosphate synthase, type II